MATTAVQELSIYISDTSYTHSTWILINQPQIKIITRRDDSLTRQILESLVLKKNQFHQLN